MAIPLYRSLSFKENKKIEDSVNSREGIHLGTPKKIEEFTQTELAHAYESIDNHIRNGNVVKSNEIFSVTSDFQTALRFAKPIVVIKENKVVHIKIKRSSIAVFNEDTINKNILNYEDVKKFHRQEKNISNTAFNYTMGTCELIITGRVDEFYILTKLYQDLLFCAEEDNFFKILNLVIHSGNQKKIHEFCEASLNPIEKLIYQLFYLENLNLYETLAPVYYSNEKANIYCVYDTFFEVLLSILTKLYEFLGIEISDINNLQKKLLDLYNTELNILCLRSKNDYYIQQVDFSSLLVEYSAQLNDFNKNENYVWNLSLENSIQYTKVHCNIDTSPLFLYLPKSFSENEIEELNHYFLSSKIRDYHLLKNPNESIFKNAEYKRDEEGYVCNSIKVDKYGNILAEKNDKNFSHYIYINLSIFYSELYIPPSYTSIDPAFFSFDYLKKECFNFYNWKEHTNSLTKKRYEYERAQYFAKNYNLLYTYADRLVKIFGGRNLKKVNYSDYLNERLKKRACKDEIISLFNH